jgi:hypothetical protein
MAETSMFRGVLNFFVDLGVYDVILPFLLVFGIVFAILDKTRVLGTVKYGSDENVPNKNINAIVAFVVAFFVVASAQLVQVITQVSSQMVILLLLIVLFLTLVGTFMKPENIAKGVFLEGGWQQFFMFASFIGIVLIFLNALGWLDLTYNFLKAHWNNELVGTVILLGTVLLAMLFITGALGKKPDEPATPPRGT